MDWGACRVRQRSWSVAGVIVGVMMRGGWRGVGGEVDGDVEVKGSKVEWYYLKRGEGVGL